MANTTAKTPHFCRSLNEPLAMFGRPADVYNPWCCMKGQINTLALHTVPISVL